MGYATPSIPYQYIQRGLLNAKSGCNEKNTARNTCESKKRYYLCIAIAEVAQLVEHNLAKVRVAGSSPVFRSKGAIDSGLWEVSTPLLRR